MLDAVEMNLATRGYSTVIASIEHGLMEDGNAHAVAAGIADGVLAMTEDPRSRGDWHSMHRLFFLMRKIDSTKWT